MNRENLKKENSEKETSENDDSGKEKRIKGQISTWKIRQKDNIEKEASGKGQFWKEAI